MSTSSPSSSPVRRLDPAPLTEPVDEPALTAFIARSKTDRAPWARMTTGVPRPSLPEIIGRLMPILFPLLGLCLLLFLGGRDFVEAVVRLASDAPVSVGLVLLGIAAFIVSGLVMATFGIIRLIRSLIIPRSWWVAAFRLSRFAGSNGLRYGHDEPVPYPGVIFGTGTDRVAERRLTTSNGRRIEIGNYRYTIPAENKEDSRVFGWGYVAITLDRRLPHLLLDAKANNRSVFGIRASNLPIELASDQKLSLGGEFDEKFTLYAPTEYGRDAFFVFTPDLMALFIDRLGTYDVEIIDDTMFVYGSRFDLLNPRTYDWLSELVDTVVARTVRRTERYTDDFAALEADPRQPASVPLDPATAAASAPAGVFAFAGDGAPQTASNTIAAGGRRLRRRRWGPAAVFVLLMIAFWIYNDFVAPLFGLPRLDT